MGKTLRKAWKRLDARRKDWSITQENLKRTTKLAHPEMAYRKPGSMRP